MFSRDNKSDRETIRQAARVVLAVADGDFEQRIIGISDDPEIAEFQNAINRLIDRTDAYLRESQACVEYVRQNKHFRLIPETGMVGSYKRAARAVNTTLWGIKQRHESFMGLASSLETELGSVMDSVNASIQGLQDAAKHLDQASSDADGQCTSVAAGAEEASANMNSVAASAEELTCSIGEINREVERSAGLAANAVNQATEMNTTIDGLAAVSRDIGEIVCLINDIAEQTNLLALNATIEAARAGEAGRGFAVVASEVKTLAGQTAQATEQISQNIGGLQTSVDNAVNANETIRGAIENINASFNAIAGAVSQQSDATGEIARNVDQAARGTTEVTQGVTGVQRATSGTRETVHDVVTLSETLNEQKTSLSGLQENISHFLTDLRKTG